MKLKLTSRILITIILLLTVLAMLLPAQSVLAVVGVVFRSYGQSTGADSTSCVIVKPVGLAVGDLMIAQVVGSGATPLGTFTASANWTSIRQDTKVVSFFDVASALFWKIADAADVAAANFTFTATGCYSNRGAITAWYGHNPTTPINASSGQGNAPSATVTAPTITPSMANCLILMFCAVDWTTTQSAYAIANDNPASWTERYDLLHSSPFSVALSVGTATRPETTATGLGTATVSSSLWSNVGQLVAIMPYVAPPTVTTGSISSITATTAIGSGNITDIGDENADIRGVCWNTIGTPTITDSKSQEIGSFTTGTFTENMTGLTHSTFYYVSAYAHNSGGYAYGSSTNFTTDNTTPTVTTQSASSINATTAVGNYTLTDTGGANPTTIGIQWGTVSGTYTTNVTQGGSFVVGSYTANMTGLTAGITYYYRGEAQNTEGWGYGNEMSFTTSPPTPATVVTIGSGGIGVTSATLNGQLISLGSENSSSVGFQYGTTTSYGSFTAEIEKTAVGSYSIQIAGLSYATTYHFRATARYGLYYVYGADMTFTTLPAVGSSTDLLIRSAEVFPNYGESGSLLFCVEYVNNYTYLFPDKSPAKYFSVQVLATNNIDVLASTPLPNWGDRPVGIYINPTYASSSFVYGTHYYIKLIANTVTGSPASGMSVEYQLTDNDWNGGAQDVNYNPLDSWCIGTAYHMEIADSSYNYITLTTDVGKQINDNAGGYFTSGIAGIGQVRPDLFTTSQSAPTISAGTANNAWDSLTAWATNVGSSIAADVTVLGTPFGVSGRHFLIALVMVIIVVLMVAAGSRPLGVFLLSLPIIWGATYFKIMPIQVWALIEGFFGFWAIRQFILKTL